ncbi:MAG: glycosyltransferase family 4 protein [Armatimonadetes bacterium]|nr:glycosyltransferase family 4 protein [Armatimonadota bacterium]
MRVLILRRQEFGGIATYTNLLADALHDEDVEAVVDDADDWIPNKTGWRVDREVGKVLKAAARGFDIVHAFGYRTAWACSAAFYVSEPWVYTAYDMPRTTHVELVKRLNTARIGLCSSHAVRNKLAEAFALNLEVIPPGIRANTRVLDRQESRGMYGVSDDEILIVAAGRFVEERGFESLIAAVHSLPKNFRLILSGQGPLEDSLVAAAGDRATVTHELFSQQVAMAAADLVVVPSTRAGFSYTALEAMHQGVPVLLKGTGGLPEMYGKESESAVYSEDSDLAAEIERLLGDSEQLDRLRELGKERAAKQFDIKDCAAKHASRYRQILGK